MADSQLRVLIDALWKGKGATAQARSDIRGMGQSADSASVQMAALRQRSGLLQGKLSELGREVARGGKTVDQATREYQEFRNSLAQIDPVAQKTGSSISSLLTTAGKLTVAIGAAGVTAKKAFDLSEEGANINQLRESFDRLNASVLQTPDLLGQMEEASRGTVSEVQAMEGVLKLVAGTSNEVARELGGASPQLLEIAKAANKLNPTLGDTAFLYESITTGIKRASPLILDNLGIVVKVGEANEAYAAALGKTVQQLTAEEKQIALLNATLEAGDNLIQQVGGNVDSQADNWLRLRVNIAEAGDAFKTQFAEGLEDMDWDQLNRDVSELSGNLADLTGVALKAVGPLQSLANVGRAVMEFPLSPPGFVMMLFDLVNGSEDAEFAMSEAQLAAARYEDSLRAQMSAGQGAVNVQRSLATSARETGGALDELSEAHQELARQVRAGERQADDFSESLDRLRRGQGEGIVLKFTTDTEPVRAELEDLITDYSGRQIPFEILPTIRGRGAEHAVGEEVMRPAKEALSGIFDEAVLKLQPQIEMQNSLEMESAMGNIITNSDYINTTTLTPRTVNDHVAELEELAREGRNALNDINANSPYEARLDTNLAEENAQLGAFYSQWLRLRSKSISLNVNYNTGGNPHTGPYDTGGAGGPQFNAPSLGGPAPSLGFNGGRQMMGGPNIGTLQINVTESGDPRRTAREVMQELERHGMAAGARLR